MYKRTLGIFLAGALFGASFTGIVGIAFVWFKSAHVLSDTGGDDWVPVRLAEAALALQSRYACAATGQEYIFCDQDAGVVDGSNALLKDQSLSMLAGTKSETLRLLG